MAVEELDDLPIEEIPVVETQKSGDSIVIDGRYQIMPDSPVSELDSPTASAFSCRDTADPNHSVFALVCNSILPPRTDDLAAFRRVDRPNILTPHDWAVVDWPGAETRRFAMIVERPGGRRIMREPNEEIRAFNEDRLTKTVLRPVLSVMKALQEAAVTHRSIRVDNMFFRDAVGGEVVLGEGFTAPAGMNQPVVYEPVDSGMCEPGGRGVGTLSDDMYSLGVVLAILLRGQNPCTHMSDEEIVNAKLTDGSYSVLIGDARVNLGLMEVLRGLLTDDPSERWGTSDLELWLNGRRLSPKQPKLPPKAARPFRFNNVDYFTAPSLAQTFATNWLAATRAIGNEPIDTWIRRSLGNEAQSTHFVTALRTAAAFGGRRGIEDRMVSRACIALDPAAPIRYRKFVARIDGFSSAILTRFVKTGEIGDVAEALVAKLPHFWLDSQGAQKPEHQILRRTFEMMVFMLSRTGPGYGVERCLYEANHGCPCLSPLIEKYYVINLSNLLSALDEAAITKSGKGEPMDRHLAAFIASRLKHPMDNHLLAIAHPTSVSTRRMGLMRLLAEVQQYTGEPTPPHLAQWLATLMEPVVQTYHSRHFRDRLSKEMSKLAEKGSLMDMAYALENTARREKDHEGFQLAVQEYAECEAEIAKIEAGEMTKPETIEKKGQEYAALASGSVAMVTLFAMVAVKFLFG
ncbi:MAG: hypothetical protein AAF220_01445 [Pseudomonadota bacterium]